MVEYGLEWCALTSYFQMVELASEPNTPQANHLRLYALDKAGASALYYKNDAGTVFDLSGVANAVHTTDADWIDLTDGGATTLHSHAGSVSIGSTITSATAGSVLFAGASGVLAQDNANFFWDDSTNRLGIGTAAPGNPLHVITTVVDGIKVSAGSALPMSLLVSNTVGNGRLFTVGASNDFMTGSLAGDAGIRFTDTGRLLIGISTAIRFVVGASGQWGIGGATYGTSGQVFTSGGSGAAPTWTTPTGGANFGPGLPTTITVVNGHVTAIA